jgi:hypothetical protein
MTAFCHISPTPHLADFCLSAEAHLLLAHLVETDQRYTDFYADEVTLKILDNSAFEMYKQGRPMYPSDKLIEMGHRVGAEYIVMSDYPGEAGIKTIDAARRLAPQFRKHNFKTFFVPQSRVGDVEDYIDTFEWAANADEVDYIGVSILGVPNAYGVEKNNKLQRFLSRWSMMNELESRGILDMIQVNEKKIHFLGMVDGPREIELVKDYLEIINTWDSSAAVWAGLNNIRFDNSPTGLVNGKFEKEVDFDFYTEEDFLIDLAHDNINFIEGLIDNYS